MKKNDKYLVILYYQYVNISNTILFSDAHFKYCHSLGLLGRVIVANEGINGTLSGKEDRIREYMQYLQQDPRFANTVFKTAIIDKHPFPRLSVKIKPELVNLNLKEKVDLSKDKGTYLSPEQFHQAMQEKETVILDARNDYEYDLGHFRNAINPNVRNFRELPNWVEQNEDLLKGKKIITYCTGGVRCEKFSAFLKNKGFNQVYQLDGGVISYANHPQTKGDLWDGKLYVFDQRIAVKVNQKEHVVVGKDYFDQTPCERYINCSNPQCNKQILCHKKNEDKYLGACCQSCSLHPQNRYLLKNKDSITTK